MGKSGPCCHCGVTSTPLWRNGPHDKPVLCNACGTRWRTKGSLVNYIPLHVVQEDIKPLRADSTQFKRKDKKILKIKRGYEAERDEHEMPYVDQNFRKALEGITSNRSSSGSATSYSESCANFDAVVEASDLTGSAQSNVWESQVLPMKKAHGTRAKPTQVEILTKELYAIMQEQQCSNEFSSPSDLLFENESQLGSYEIGSGSVLLRNPNRKAKEDESEASSFSFHSKSSLINDVYSGSASLSQNKHKKITLQVAQGADKSRDKSYIKELHYAQHKNSPLVFTDLKDVVNFEVLEKYMSNEEKQGLNSLLASVDTDNDPLSLKAMFESPQFAETFIYFQQLLQEGIFEPSTTKSEFEGFNTMKNFALHNFSRSAWIVHYQKLKAVKGNENDGETQKAMNTNYSARSMLTPLKRSRNTLDSNIPGPKNSMKSVQKVGKSCRTNGTNSHLMNYNSQKFADNDGTRLRSIYPLPPEKNSMLSPFQSIEDKNSSNRDLLLYNKNNNFPECQLITEADGEESCFSFPKFSFSTQTPKNL